MSEQIVHLKTCFETVLYPMGWPEISKFGDKVRVYTARKPTTAITQFHNNTNMQFKDAFTWNYGIHTTSQDQYGPLHYNHEKLEIILISRKLFNRMIVKRIEHPYEAVRKGNELRAAYNKLSGVA